MATEMVTFKLESEFLKDIDSFVKSFHYQSRTEFIREALRERLIEYKLKSLMDPKKELSSAEKRARRKELDGKDPLYVFRKLDLDPARAEVLKVTRDDVRSTRP